VTRKLPGEHNVQFSPDVAFLKDPAGQFVHAAAPRVSANLPAAHIVHITDAVEEANFPNQDNLQKLPIGSGITLKSSSTFDPSLYLPVGQFVQVALLFSAANLPFAQV
jgi:hypothetical protein